MDFERLRVDEQLAYLESELETRPPSDLLKLCAAVRDHTPLAWLSARLLERGWLSDPAANADFAAFLLDLPDTSVQKVVRAMLDVGSPLALRQMLLRALRASPIEKLSTTCILDRSLKHNFSDVRDSFVRETTDEMLATLERGAIDEIDPADLARISGRSVRDLLAAADRGGVGAEFEAMRRQAAARAIDVLGEVPKAVSQSNAEELLSTRVYTDPGHFLIELLQNAEDAGATRWRVSFERERIVVWHDGAPFDFRDVVGVTSIGQTTKRKTQIGFFGVGFKSIYEVTSRPQIYSDVFDFEIVDVSVPRWLGSRPDDVPAEGTVLVLPLRDPGDPARAPLSLYEKARALDPCVLFTLRGIDEIDLELGPDCAGGPRRWLLRESEPDELGRSVIDVDPDGEKLHYLVRDDTYDFDDGTRAAGRPDATPVMVGVRLDQRGHPRPLDDRAPNIYSYLPTDERAGLRFFVQGHFDVPVDRERITPESAWNRWILEKVPAQLRRIAEQLGAGNGLSYDAARGFLTILPLATDLNTPIFGVVSDGLGESLGDIGVLPCTDGETHRPDEVLYASPEVSVLLEGEPIDARWLARMKLERKVSDTPSWRYLLATDLDTRSVDVARELGCGEFGLEDLVDVVAVAFAAAPDDESLPLRKARSGDLDRLERLYDVLLQGVERLQRDGGKFEAMGLVHRLRRIPIVACADGTLRRSTEVSRGTGQIRSVYGERRAFVAERFDRTLWSDEEDEPRAERVDALLDRLNVRQREVAALLNDVARTPAEFTRDEDQRRAVVELIADAAWAYQRRAAQLPLFRCTDGALHAAANDPSDLEGALVPTEGPIGAVLSELYADARPLVDEEHAPSVELLRRAKTSALDIDTLVADLRAERVFDRPGDLLRVHRALATIRDELSERDRRRLAETPIWPDRSGRLRPLTGPDRTLVPDDDEIASVAVAPFVDPAIGCLEHVREMANPVGAQWLVEQLVQATEHSEGALPEWLTDPGQLQRVSTYLAARVDEMARQRAAVVPTLPIFVGETADGEVCLPLGNWEEGIGTAAAFPCTAEAEEVLRAAGIPIISSAKLDGIRGLIDAELARVIGADELLLHAAGLQPVSGTEERSALQRPEALRVLGELVAERAESLTPSILSDLCIIPTSDGGVNRPSALVVDESHVELFAPHSDAARHFSRLTPSEEARLFLATLADRGVQFRSAVGDVLHHLTGGDASHIDDHEHLDSPDRRERFYEWLARHGSVAVADDQTRESLRDAALFPNEKGALLPLRKLVTDVDIGGLGADWRPHREVPRELIDNLTRQLGVGRRLPDAAMLLEALREPVESISTSESIAKILSELFRSGEISDAELTRFAPLEWVADAAGDIRRPDELFVRSHEVETLAGEFDDLYPHSKVEHHLGEEIAGRIGFKTADEVPLPLVVRHLRYRSTRREPVRMSLYAWLDRGIEQGWVDAAALDGLLGDTSWIFTDDEEWFHHDKVLGSREMQMFGQRRGYWVRGAAECPNLCRAFGIRGEVAPSSVVAFLREIDQESRLRGDRALLADDPALPRMLLSCYAHLGENRPLSTGAVPILCREKSQNDPVALRLRSSRSSTLLRSDTPTLEALFARVGVLHVAATGSEEQAAAIDQFYGRIGVERLRDAYEVRVASEAVAERTEAHAGSIDALRGWLRALLAVLPRVRQQRGGRAGAWVYDEALHHVIEARAIRAMDDLRVRFVLTGVGEVEETVASAYDPEARELLVDTSMLARPEREATGLALGLMPAIYDGPGEDQIVDILVILLPLRTRDRMDAYLDSRHFPVARTTRTPSQRISERLLEVLDFGLGRRLCRTYPVLDEVDLERWREPEVAGRATGENGKVTRHGAALLFDAVGVTEPGDELIEALYQILTAPSIDDVPASVFGAAEHGRSGDENEPARYQYEPAAFDRSAGFSDSVPASGLPSTPTESTWEGALPDLRETPERKLPPFDERPSQLIRELIPPENPDAGSPSGPRIRREEGFWGRVKSWFSEDEPRVEPATVPRWARPDANPFVPEPGIGPQLWVTPERLREVAASRSETGVRFRPGRLPRPYKYAMRSAGGLFAPATQRWLPLEATTICDLASGTPTGQTVTFEGVVDAGVFQLPFPLHSRMLHGPQSSDGSRLPIDRRPDGTIWTEAKQRGSVRYVVELLDPPVLVTERDGTPAIAEFRMTSLRRHELPGEFRRWLAAQSDDGPAWERAIAIQEFVRSRYVYDEAFMEHPDVAREVGRLVDGEGNHHLQLLHASADTRVLGRGVCYELNVLLVELLRHAKIAAFPASGWVLDRGFVDRPDHLFAVAVVESMDGFTLLPLDAATTPAGETIRPMANEHDPGHTSAISAPTGAWNSTGTPHVAGLETTEAARMRALHRMLVEAVSFLHSALQTPSDPELRRLLELDEPDADDLRRLRKAGESMLGDAALFSTLLGTFRNPEVDPDAMTAELRELVDRGLVTIETTPRYVVKPLRTQ